MFEFPKLEKETYDGKEWVSGCCPLHDDKKPSFSYSKITGSWKCFSGCGSGNYREFQERYNPTAIRTFPEIRKPPKELPPIREEFVTQCQEHLVESAQKYLAEHRGILLDTIRKYQIGWCAEEQRNTIPIRDEHGTLVNIRMYNGKKGKFKMMPYTQTVNGEQYSYGSPVRLYGIDELVKYQGDEVIICEGEWDRLLLQQNGFMAVTGTGGCDTFRSEWVKYFKGKDVVIIYDCDSPGQESATARLIPMLKDVARSVKNVVLPLKGTKDDKDITDYFHKKGFNKADLQELINTTPVHNYKDADEPTVRNIKEAVPGLDLKTGKISNIGYFCNYLIKQHHLIFDRGELHFYHNGVYVPQGSAFVIKKLQEILGANFTINNAKQVIYYLEGKLKTIGTDDTAKLDADPRLINVENGLLDWIKPTPALLPHTPDFLSSIRIPVTYDPKAECPAIEKFIAEVLQTDCIDLVYEMFGYCLIPDTCFEKAFMLVGSGANGKSTLLKLLQIFIGTNNYSSEALQDLAENRFRAAELTGKLANICSDLPDRTLHDSSQFKILVSGDVTSVERKHQTSFKFKNNARLIFSANTIPQSSDITPAFYRRWVIIPFPNEFKGTKADKSLISKLTSPEELSGLLNKALKGLVRLFTNEQFTEPDSTQNELKNYQLNNDPVKMFIEENCIVKADQQIGKKDLYDCYKTWCESCNLRPLSDKRFNDRLKNNVTVKETRIGKMERKRIWQGIGIYSDVNFNGAQV